jgi:D-beta-D-heptose 7-phosphate kinase/D-beta-D-heptose 1-phosphate adenosyltransferase
MIVVVGDALLDVDLVGRAGRLCPDAPVPVVEDLHEVNRPGGAALAAALAAEEAGEVVLVTTFARDDGGALLERLLEERGVRVVGTRHLGVTTVKKRVRAAGQSLLRLDTEGDASPLMVDEEVLRTLTTAGTVLVSDYGRGVTSATRLREVLESVARQVPVVWDPHPRGGRPVAGARLVTPNQVEAATFACTEDPAAATGTGLAALSAQAALLVRSWSSHAVAVTLGKGGALVSHGESSPSVVPARPVEAGDTCGAGDRFASRAATALAAGAVGADAGDRRGVPDRVRAAGGTVVATGGCFDILHAGHVATLEAARRLGDCLVVCVNSDASVRRLKGPGRPLVTQQDRVRVLAALECVDEVVVFDEDTPEQALRRLRPDVWVKGGDYAGAELPEAALLRSWGGQSVVVPYLEGRSTTGLVATAARSGT